MDLFCNGDSAGSVEHVEWKDEAEPEGKVTFMVPFDFDWETHRNSFLELAESGEGADRYMISEIQRIDEGAAGDFVVARYKPLG